MYELKDYLKAINQSKEKLMDGDDEEWEKKYPPFKTKKKIYSLDEGEEIR